jgi:RNA polymerase sigma factor for flagellar operon FliA
MESVTRELATKLGRTPTETELADCFGVELDRWRRMVMELRTVGLISSAARGPDGDPGPVPDFPAHPDSRPDSMCVREQLRHMLATALDVLPDRYRKVVFLYYTNGMTMKQIGDMLGVNESRVSQIHKTALEKMAVALHSAGIHSSAAF